MNFCKPLIVDFKKFAKCNKIHLATDFLINSVWSSQIWKLFEQKFNIENFKVNVDPVAEQDSYIYKNK